MDVGDWILLLMTSMFVPSPSQFVSNIRHQHRCNRMTLMLIGSFTQLGGKWSENFRNNSEDLGISYAVYIIYSNFNQDKKSDQGKHWLTSNYWWPLKLCSWPKNISLFTGQQNQKQVWPSIKWFILVIKSESKNRLPVKIDISVKINISNGP